MAAKQADEGQQLAAAIRALRDALAGHARQFLPGPQAGQNASTIIHLLGASLEDAQALHDYLAAHPAAEPGAPE